MEKDQEQKKDDSDRTPKEIWYVLGVIALLLLILGVWMRQANRTEYVGVCMEATTSDGEHVPLIGTMAFRIHSKEKVAEEFGEGKGYIHCIAEILADQIREEASRIESKTIDEPDTQRRMRDKLRTELNNRLILRGIQTKDITICRNPIGRHGP